MTLKERVVAAAEEILVSTPDGLTDEALARQVAQKVGRQMPPGQVTGALREQPRCFVQGTDGRWRLRAREGILTPEEAEASREARSGDRPAAPLATLRRGYYVVFDLEATGQEPRVPATEIIQIAAWRWIDGQPQAPWVTFVRPSARLASEIIRLTGITDDDVRNAPPVEEALRAFFAYVGDLPLIAHNGANYDGPLITAMCARLGMPVPPTFRVLDTLPLARVLLPLAPDHRVVTLAERFGCARPGAHHADVDVEMLGGIVMGLERELHNSATGTAVYDLLRRADDAWSGVLAPPPEPAPAADIIARFCANITPLLPERPASAPVAPNPPAVDGAFAQAEQLGHTRREPQIDLAHLVASTFAAGGYTTIEAGTGTGKSLGYLLPAALHAVATGQPVAVSTFTRVLQTQLVERELPFVQRLVPGLTYALLQGRANYLSVSRLAEEVEDALAEDSLPAARAWTLATLVRFAEASAHGNLEELGYIPQALDDFLQADGAVWQTIAAVRASQDDGHIPGVDFYRRARANVERADIVMVNHALLLASFLGDPSADEPFAARVVCDEAHTLEDAATLALEQRVEERGLRRLLRAVHNPQARTGLVVDCRRHLGLSADDPDLQAWYRPSMVPRRLSKAWPHSYTAM